MKLGIMQPYFFPYIGYFQLIAACDKYIFFDTPQFERRSWMNRNRIINIAEGSTYISVPVVKAPQKTAICDMHINNSTDWREKLLAQLEVYKKRAPYYRETMEIVRSVIARETDSLVEMSVASVIESCKYMGLDLDWDIFSQMELDVPSDCEPDEWALEICRALGADEYVNAPGGEAFFDKSKYQRAGIKLEFLQPELLPYTQRIGRFEPGLSIIDVMMYNSPEKIREMLNAYSLK